MPYCSTILSLTKTGKTCIPVEFVYNHTVNTQATNNVCDFGVFLRQRVKTEGENEMETILDEVGCTLPDGRAFQLEKKTLEVPVLGSRTAVIPRNEKVFEHIRKKGRGHTLTRYFLRALTSVVCFA